MSRLLLCAALLLGCGKAPPPARQGESCNYEDLVTGYTIQCERGVPCVKKPGCFDCIGKCTRTCSANTDCLGSECRCAASTDNPAYNVCVGPGC